MNYVKKLKYHFIIAAALTLLGGCSKDKDDAIDTEYPTIDVAGTTAFPKQCSELLRGEKYKVNVLVADNMALGSVSVDVHHNFDHHSHSTEVSTCDMEAIKTPINPFLLVKSITIPADNKSYTASTDIEIPTDVDTGDYHFLIRVTDKEGWQTIKGLSIKIK